MLIDSSRVRAAWLSMAVLIVASNAVAGELYEAITDKEIEAVNFEDSAYDNGFVAPFAPNLDHLEGDQKTKFEEWSKKLDDWAPGKEKEIGQRVRNWICLATLSDVARGEFEGESPYEIFERLKKDIPKDQLIKATAWVALKPDEGSAVLSAPEAGIDGEAPEGAVRERAILYAKKMLGRLLGKLPLKEN